MYRQLRAQGGDTAYVQDSAVKLTPTPFTDGGANGVLLPLDDLAGFRRTIVSSGLLTLILLELGVTSGVKGWELICNTN